ncbi:MAG: hypothetical protein JWM99_406 [Verrucomicrobiales bacterium]|nr:hypothetical protein [Verrucomicrobiales bacterium]
MISVSENFGLIVERDSPDGPGNASTAAFSFGMDDAPGLDLPLIFTSIDDAGCLAPTINLNHSTKRCFNHELFLFVSRRWRPGCIVSGASAQDRGQRQVKREARRLLCHRLPIGRATFELEGQCKSLYGFDKIGCPFSAPMHLQVGVSWPREPGRCSSGGIFDVKREQPCQCRNCYCGKRNE